MWVQSDYLRFHCHWLAPYEGIHNRPKLPFHPNKVMICLVDTQGIVHRELLPAGQTVNGYSEHLELVHEKLVNLKGVVLLLDNAKPHA